MRHLRIFGVAIGIIVLVNHLAYSQSNDVRLWGVSQTGPLPSENGFIFSSNPDGTDFITHKAFESSVDGALPFFKMMKGTDGFYYGTTKAGGAKNGGVIYKINGDGTGYTKIYEFDPEKGFNPTELIEGSDGRLYGGLRSSQILFSIDKTGQGFTVLLTLHTPTAIGNSFTYGLIQGSDGFLYGTTIFGGANNSGTIYKVKPNGSEVQKVFDLSASDSHESRLLEGHDGLLYWLGGSINRVLSRVSKSGTQHEVLKDVGPGTFSHELLQLADHTLVGVVPNGSPGSLLFEIQPDGSDYHELYTFTTCSPESITIGANGKIYGAGPDGGQGTIFRIDANGSNFTVLRSNAGMDDGMIFRGLVETTPGNFLGIAASGAAGGNGGIFTINDAGTYSLHKEFPAPNGITPATKLLLASNGNIYGTTEAGGEHGYGTIFRIATDGSNFTKIHDFDVSSFPQISTTRTSLLEAGGFLVVARGSGLWRIGLDGSGYTMIHSNTFPDNTVHMGNMLVGQDGAIYGLKSSPINQNVGFVFKINPNGTGYTEILNLSVTKATTGSMPVSINQLPNSDLIVTTAANGPAFAGTIFTMKPDGSNVFVVKANEFSQLPAASGNAPIEGSDGLLYATTFFDAPVFSIAKNGTGLTNYPANFNLMFGSLVEVSGKRLYGLSLGLVRFDMQSKEVKQFLFPQQLAPASGITAVPKLTQTVTLDPIGNKTFGPGSFYVSATSTLGGPITYSSSNTSVATVISNVVTMVGAGTTTIKAYQAGSVTLSDAADTETITILKSNVAVALASLDYGKAGSTVQLQAATGVHNGVVSYSTTNGTGTATLDGDKLTLLTPGTITVTLTVAEAANYAQAQAQQVFTIELPAPQASFTSAASGNAGTSLPVTVNSGGSTGQVSLHVENIGGTATLSGNTLTLTTPGKVKVTATIAADATHSATTIVQIVTINNTNGTPPDKSPRIVGLGGRGANESGMLFQLRADFTNFSVLNHFQTHPHGAASYQTQLLNMGDGNLYGIALGGEKGNGVLFKYSTSTGAYTVEYTFQQETGWGPAGYLVLASDGKIYGLTNAGGANDHGVVYQFDYINKVYTKKFDLKLDQTGYAPRGGFVESTPGRLFAVIDYGGANNGGTIVEYDMTTGVLTKKHDFPAGSNPNPYLALAPNGKFYGMTGLGGNNGEGMLFEFDPANGVTTIKVHLDRDITGTVPLGGLTLGANGKLYGHPNAGNFNAGIMEYVPGATSAVSVFGWNVDTGVMPFGNMISATDGKMYGLASFGAANNWGAIFQFDPVTHQAVGKYAFHRVTGASPYGALVEAPNGKFYGMAGFGGAHEYGVLFEFDPSNNTYSVKKDFIASENGSAPGGRLLIEDNKIYGAAGGGTTGLGLIYEYNESTGVYTKKAELNAQSGTAIKGLIRHPNGKVYSAAEYTSPNGPSRIFEFNMATGAFTVLATLPQLDRLNSFSLASDGKFYGTATGGNGDGLIFEFDPATNTYTKKFDFLQSQSGQWPTQIAEGPDEILYGTTRSGGPHNGGVLFSYDYDQNLYTSLYNFGDSGGPNYPHGKLAFNDGKVFGLLLNGGQFSRGGIFEYQIPGHNVNILKHLEKTVTESGLIVGLNNTLIGTFAVQGPGNYGSIFQFHPGNAILETKFEFDGVNGSRPTELVLVKGEQVISFGPIGPLTAGSGSLGLTAIASSGLQVTYSSSNPAIASVVGNELVPHIAGEVKITASQSGDAAYNAAAPVEITIQVIKATQTITFIDGAATLDSSPYTFLATTTSGLPITYTTTSDKLTINGEQATLLKAGRASIKASQAGDATYNAAVPVERNLCIVPNKPVISGSLDGSPPYTLTSSNDSGNQWYYNGVEMTGNTGKTLTVLTAGSYTVITTIDDCFSETSAPAIVLVTGVNEVASQRINLYPNPAEHEVNIEVADENNREISITMIDGVGRVIEQRQSHTNTPERFATSGLPKGIFYFRVNSAGSFLSYKFEKQ